MIYLVKLAIIRSQRLVLGQSFYFHMKNDLHPEYHHDIKVACSCGKTFVTGSTLPSMQVEICSNCHPFYTGQQKLIDTAGRVDKFKARAGKQADAAAVRKGKKAKRAVKAQAKAEDASESK